MRSISIKQFLFTLISLGAIGIALYALFTSVMHQSEMTYQAQQGISNVQTAAAVVSQETIPSAVANASTTPETVAAPALGTVIAPAKVEAKSSKAIGAPEKTTIAPPPPPPVPPAPALYVSAGDQPASSLALSGAGGVPFTAFTLTAGDQDVTVNSVTVERVGPGQDGIFDSVDLTDESNDDLGEMHLDVNHKMVFAESLVIPAHSSKTLSLTANMVSDLSPFEGEAPKLQVDVIDASVPITGTLPIIGTAQTVNSTLQIGAATAMLSQFDPGADETRYIGDKNVRFSGIRITANSDEDLTLGSITWRQNGTVSNGDVTNITTFVNGNSYPAQADGREYTSSFSPGIVIHKGESVDVYVQGDLLSSGAQRTVKFDIDGSGDVSLTGNTYGYGVSLAAEGDTATTGDSVFITSDGTTDGDEGTPFYSAPTITINGGSVINIQNAN